MSLVVTGKKYKDSEWYAYVWDTDDDTFEYISIIELGEALHNGIIIDNFDFNKWNIVTWRNYLKGKLFEFNTYPIKILSTDNMLIVWVNADVVMSKMLLDFNFEFYFDESEKILTVIIESILDRVSINLSLIDGYCKLGARNWLVSSHFRASWRDTLKKGVLL